MARIILKKNKIRGINLLNFTTIKLQKSGLFIGIRIGNIVQWNNMENPEINPYVYDVLIFDIRAKIIQLEKGQSFQ